MNNFCLMSKNFLNDAFLLHRVTFAYVLLSSCQTVRLSFSAILLSIIISNKLYDDGSWLFVTPLGYPIVFGIYISITSMNFPIFNMFLIMSVSSHLVSFLVTSVYLSIPISILFFVFFFSKFSFWIDKKFFCSFYSTFQFLISVAVIRKTYIF